MKERGMIFNSEMVRAILDGRKTQTRRIVKGVPSSHDFHGWILSSFNSKDEGKACWAIGKSHFLNQPIRVRCPFGAIGDRIWVRESFRVHSRATDVATLVYKASVQNSWTEQTHRVPVTACNKPVSPEKWTPSIHMPRWASRITLEITDVRVERLNSITEQDAIDEGCHGGHDSIPGYMYSATPHEHFHHIWESIYGADSWQANPWVWVISFRRIEGGE